MKHELGVRKSRKQRKSSSHDSKMCGELFTYLTPAIIINILSRLPIRTILSCKCVCKPWLDLIESREFWKLHLSRSVPGLAVFLDANHPKPFKIFEFADELNLNRRVRGWNLDLVFNFNLPCAELLHSSANGLLFLCNRGLTPRDFSSITIDDFKWSRDLFICNPITRDYIRLPCPQLSSSSNAQFQMDTYGFGVSRTSEEHKLVRIFHGWIRELGKLTQSECQVYTVGTDSWRKVASGGGFVYGANAVAAFVNGNLHWLIGDLVRSSVRISCFDLETELFTTFSPPPSCDRGECLSMSALEGSLCLCDSSAGDEIVIWLMKEYGDEKSWTKEFVIRRRSHTHGFGVVCPIKVFKNGDILMALETCTTTALLYFTSKTKIIRKFDVFGLDCDFGIRAVMYTPSFLRLKTFAMENGFRKSRREKNTDQTAKMSYDFLTHLPREIVMDIFSRLPVRAIMICKCVCESWLELVESGEFVKSHICKSVPGIPLFLEGALSKPYKVVEFAEESGFNGDHEHPWKVDFRFNLPCHEPLHSSVNGLLFLCNRGPRSRDLLKFIDVDVVWACKLFICNPVTRDYITPPCPRDIKYPLQTETYGFGASRMSGQYKLVRMFHGWIRELQKVREYECHCQVYTLGTGLWRRIGSGERRLKYPSNAVGVFVNGNLHWVARDLDDSLWISCFDLETEVLSTFSTPPAHRPERWTLCALGNCLGLCVNTSGEEESDNQLVIWSMKVYGDENSWTKELVIDKEGRRNDPSFDLQVIQVLRNGDILMVMDRRRKLLYYSIKTKALQQIDVAEPDCKLFVRAIMYTPTFLSLKTFARENGVRKSRRLIEAAQKLKLGTQDLMKHLPSEILMNILLRLPLGDIMRCKCVCKELVDLVMTPEFVKSHLSQAVPGLVIFDWETQTKPYKIVEFVENLDLNNDECRWGVVLNFDLPFHEGKPMRVHSSANGLLFLYKRGFRTMDPILSICNPITRDYIKLPCPEQTTKSPDLRFVWETYGFGMSRISGEYKVVRMFMEIEFNTRVKQDQFECQVYTVGTGLWRRVASGRRLKYDEYSIGAFLNGNIHWVTYDFKSRSRWISCFDLETELFTTFSTPPHDPFSSRNLSILGDRLCLCDNGQDEYTGGYEIDIWLMKDYGDHNSWIKEFVIRKVHDTDFLGRLCPIKVFEDGDILIEWYSLLYYSNKKTIRRINAFGLDCNDESSALIYTPTFVQLKTFAMENVLSF